VAFDPVTIPGPLPVPGELYKPSGTAPTGLVVIAYGTDGWKDPWTKMMRGYAEDLAGRGVFALMPDYFARTKTKHGGAAATEIGDKQDDWTAALVDTVAFARTLPRVDASRIGMLGFSLGGYLCLRARAAAKPEALVEYFAPMFEGIGAAGSVPVAQIHHGTGDKPPTGFANAAAIAAILKREGSDATICEYKDATHGFASPSAADTKAAADSKSATLKFFETRL
jgi:carboxymethylenebutenolidase